VQDHAAAVVEAARLRLVGLSDKAIDQIEDLLENASAEGIRLKAAQDVLDRNGVKGAIEIDVTVTQTETAAERVQKRLAEIASRIPTKEINVESVVISDEIVIEGNPNDS
jgi:disulfide oxidoreductase YuzD